MRTYPLVIFDLDGTLYRGNQVIEEAPPVVAELRQRGSQVRFLTNNSSQTAKFTAEKLTKMGIVADPSEVLTSAMGAARRLPSGSRVFVVGEPMLRETLVEEGHSLVESEQADAVVVGICRSFTYAWLDAALQQVLGGARFIATNADVTYPTEGGRVVPGAGTMVAALRACTGVEPEIIGKPDPYLVQLLLEECSVAPEDCLMVGDRYETDIVAGLNAGTDVLMVLTGVTQEPPVGVPVAVDLRAMLG